MDTNDMEYIGGTPDMAYRSCKIGGECRDHSEDFMMPDYIPDIRRVTFSNVRAEVAKTSSGGGRICWECVLTYTALLLGDDNTIRNVILQSRLDGEMKADGDTENAWLEVELENAGLRATDPRRMNGRSRVCVYAYAPYNVAIAPDMNGESEAAVYIEKKTSPVRYTSVLNLKQNDQRVSEDIELDSSMPEIGDIIYCDVRPCISSSVIKDGRAELRGEAEVDLLYTDVNGEYFSHSGRIPLSTAFDLPYDEIRGSFTRARIGEVKAAAQSNAYGENKVVELDFSWDADILCAVDSECEVTSDLYSTKHEISAKSRSVTLDRFVGAFVGNLSVSGESSFEDLSIANAEGITLCRANVRINEVTRSDGGRIVMLGQVDAAIICYVGGEKEGYASCELKIPFRYEKDIDPSQDDFVCQKDVVLAAVKARLEHSKIRVDAELVISALVTVPFTEQGIAEIDIGDEIKNDLASMTLCFNSGSEDLWNIAKRYNVTSAEILERNGITEDELAFKRVLVIPSAHTSPGFSKMI